MPSENRMRRPQSTRIQNSHHEFTSPSGQSNASAIHRHRFLQAVLFVDFKRHTQSIRRTLYASAPPPNTTMPAEDFAELQTGKLRPTTAEYALDTSAPSASTITVSRSLALSFQSAFQLSFTVLVCYRSRSHI